MFLLVFALAPSGLDHEARALEEQESLLQVSITANNEPRNSNLTFDAFVDYEASSCQNRDISNALTFTTS